MLRENYYRIAGASFLVAFVAANVLFGMTAAVRVAGVACIWTGFVWFSERSIPICLDTRPHSIFYLRGTGAFIAAVAMATLGVTLLLHPQETACLLGLASGERFGSKRVDDFRCWVDHSGETGIGSGVFS